jgi:predicted MFS family arabinose efflux permease
MRGTAVGIYMAAVYIGSALASSTLVLSSVIGWRMCFIILALVTLSFVAIGFMLINNTVTPRSRRFSIQAEDSDWRSLLRNQTIIFTLIGTFFRYAAGFARGYYEALYFSQKFPGNKQDYSIINSLALLLTPVNLALAGWFSDRQEMKGKAKYRPILCAVSNFIAVPLLILMYLTDDFGLAMFCLCMVYAVGETYISISVTMMVNVTPTSLRGFRKRYLETSMLLCISFVGGCLSTVSLGFLSTSFEGLQTGLISIVVVGYFLAGLLFALAIRSYPRDLSEFQDEKLVDCNEMK